MIWQEGVCNIVCLTNLKEGTKVTKYKAKFKFPKYNIKLALDTGQQNNLLTLACSVVPIQCMDRV